jgi:hypothetical protein
MAAYVRRRPDRHAVFTTRTARRVVRSVPANPIAVRRSCTLSARIFPFDASTSSSTFGKNASISFGHTRAARMKGSPPQASRNATYRCTVFASHPHSCAAEWAQPVRSYDSKISMISLSDLVTVSPVWSVARSATRPRPTGEIHFTWPRRRSPDRPAGFLLSASQDSTVRQQGFFSVREQIDSGMGLANATVQQLSLAMGKWLWPTSRDNHRSGDTSCSREAS